MLRRLAAILYDGFLVFALLMVASLIVVALLRDAVNPNNLLFQIYLLMVAWSYFAICWRSGQTLGMKSWHIHIVGQTRSISLRETGIRYLVAIVSWGAVGLGFLWALFHPQRAAWHDLASGTRLVVRPPRKKPGANAGKNGDQKGDKTLQATDQNQADDNDQQSRQSRPDP